MAKGSDTFAFLGHEIDRWKVSEVSERLDRKDRKLRHVRLVLSKPNSTRPRRVARIRVPKVFSRRDPLSVWLTIHLRTDTLSGRKIYDLR
jgi:hypothetical protein